MTSTLLLLFTFAIGQMWGADPTSTYDVSDLISAGTITTSTTNDDLDQTIDNVVYDWNKGSSSNNVKISSQRVQLFGDGQSLTISTSSDYRIKSIRFAVGNKSNSPTAIKESADAGIWDPAFTTSAFDNGNYTFTVTPTAGGSYTFTIFKSGGTNQRADFDDIVVTYDVAPSDHPTVTYYPNGATSGAVPVDANSPYTSGDNVTVLGNSGNLAKTGMEFVGWNTSADGSGISYLAGNVISDVKANIKLYAQWAYPATGIGTITYALTYDKNEVTPSVSGVSTLSSSSTAFTLSSLTIGVNSDKKPGYSAKIENAYLNDESRNVALQFTVADGYTFTPSDVSMTIFANSTSNMKAKVVLSDGTTTVESEELSCSSSADSEVEFASGAFTGKKFTGNVNVVVYLWLTSGSGKRAYIKSPVTITGTVAAACIKPAAPTALSCTAQTVNTLTFGWTKETNAVGYVAKLYSDSGCETEVDSKDLGDVNTVTFTGLSNSTTYYCKVQSKGNGTTYCEDGNVTAAANGTTETPSCGVVTAPTSLLVGATTADGASFTIIDDADAFNYEFYVSESSTEPESSTTATHTSTDKTKDVTGLTSGTTYYAWVRSVCDADHKSAWTAANKSFKVRTNPTASFADANYIIGMSAIDVADNFTSNSEASVVYELKESYPNVTLSGSSFSATAAGAYVVVANQAGNSDYMPITKEATVTVLDNELSDIYIWQKNADHGGDGKCVTSAQANQNVNANQASTTLDYSTLVMDGMSAMGRPASPSTVTLTFSVKDAYKSSFGITNVCVYGKIEEAGGLEYSWNNVDWTAVAGGESGNNKHEFTAPAGTYAENFYIRFTNAEAGKGGLWFRNTLVTLEAKKTVTDVTEALTGAEINGAAISSENLATLLASKTLAIATAYAAAPTVTFKKEVTTTYAGGWAPDVEDVDVEVTASDITTAWSASATINAQEYTITIAKPTAPSLVTEATGFTLTSAKIATDTENFTFSGVNLTAGNVTIALESPVAGMTVSPTEVTPTAGVITDQEVTITYKSLEDVAEANVNLVVYYDESTKLIIPLTYSSTAGIEDLTPISAATTWNWTNANSGTIESLDADNIVVFANYSGWDESFKANSLAGRLQYVYRGSNYAQGHSLKFNTTVPGIVTVSFSNTSEKTVARAPRITDANGSYAPMDEADGAKTADAKSYSHAVAAGDVLIEGFEMQEGTPANMLRFYEVRFVPTFSVTYMPNGGSGAEFIVDDAATQVRAGSIFTAPASSAFVAWNTQADGKGDTYLPGAAVTADLTLHAQWETSYTVTFDLQGHGDAIAPQNIVSGGKVVKPADPSADNWDFGGWYKENTCTNAWDFATDVVTTTTTIFAKWTEDPCPTPFSLSKVVLTSASDGTVTGYNGNEYAGEKVIGGLKDDDQTAEVDPSHEGVEEGYKLNNGGSGIVFATLKKGTFQEGDRVVVTITKKQDAYKVEEVSQPILDIYYGTDKNDATFLTTIENVTAAGTYTYRLTAADVTAIGTKKGIGVFRPSSGRTQNPYVYSVEIQGCRSWAEFHTLTFKNIDGTATIADESLEEGAVASTVAPTAPKIATKRFLGWAEAVDGTPVDLTTYTITEDKTLYAVYEDIVCPTSGTVYKFEIKDELSSENLPTITDKDMSSYITATGDGYLTYTATANNKATINSDGTIQMKDASAAYLKVELECALAAGDQIRAHITGNPMRVQVAATYDSGKDLILAKDDYTFVDITSAMEGKQVLYITRSSNGNANLADFEIYRRPEVTGVTVADFTIREGASTIPTMTLSPSDDARVTSQAWSILSGDDKITIDATTGEVTGVAQGDAEIKVVLNGNPAISATATVHVVESFVQQDVDEPIVWDFSKAGVVSSAFSEQVLANVDGVTLDASQFEATKLVGSANNITNTYFQGTMLTFNATKAGLLNVRFTNGNGNVRTLKVYVGDPEVEIASWSYSNAAVENKFIEVPAGKVTLRSYQETSPNNVRIMNLEFLAVGHERTLVVGDLGTVCLPNASIARGVTVYEYQGADEIGKIVFDGLEPNELLEAGKPYIFQVNETNARFYYNTDPAVGTPDNSTALKGNLGAAITFAPGSAEAENVYFVKDHAFWMAKNTGVKIGQYRAYLQMNEVTAVTSSPAPGRRRITLGVQGEQVATGLENGELNEAPRKVLINGELFILRGEKMYDAKGQLVK